MQKTQLFTKLRAFFKRLPPILLLPLGGVLTALCLVLPEVGFLEWLTMLPMLLYLLPRVEREQLTLRQA